MKDVDDLRLGGLFVTAPPGRVERRIAFFMVLTLLLAFALSAPYARMPVGRAYRLISAYQSALSVTDMITAVLLFSLYAILNRRGLLVLASGYLFTAVMAAVHMLSIPGLFAAGGLVGGTAQTTEWLEVFWHAGFPLAVLAYALLDRDRSVVKSPSTRPSLMPIGAAVIVVIGVVGGLVLLATTKDVRLPPIMTGNGYTQATTGVAAAIWVLPVAALGAMWVRRSRSLLDLWLIVVLWAWLLHILLGFILNEDQFDLGFYAGRTFGFVAASFVLIMLLTETVTLYARAARIYEAEITDRERRLDEIGLELLRVSRLSELGHMASGLGHEVGQPLTAAGNYVAAALRMIDNGDPVRARGILEQAAGQMSRAGSVFDHIRSILKKGEAEQRAEVLPEVIEEAIALALLDPEIREVRLRKSFDPKAALALIDRVQVQQVIINLIRNAAQAMTEGARRDIEISTRLATDGMIELAVADTGRGLDPEIRDRLFQPFVTSKSGGIGVGLCISRSIVEAHGGRISVEDNPGGGTIVRFTLPSLTPYEATEATERRAHKHLNRRPRSP